MVAGVGGDQPRLQRRVQPRRVRRQPRAPQPHTALDSTVLANNIEKYLLVATSPSPAAATPSISWPLVSVTLSLSAASSRLCFTLTPATSPPPASTTARLTCRDSDGHGKINHQQGPLWIFAKSSQILVDSVCLNTCLS